MYIFLLSPCLSSCYLLYIPGFITYVVEPLFLEWERFLPTGLSRTMLYNVKKNKASWEEILEQEKLALAEQQDGASTGGSAGERKGSSSSAGERKGSSSSQGSQVELQIKDAITDKPSNNSLAVAKIIVDGRPPATITAMKIEQTVPEVKAKLETVKESSSNSGDVSQQEKWWC